MGTDTLLICIPSIWHETHKARARWTHQRSRRKVANLDREPPPNAPDLSPVEAGPRCFHLFED